MKVSNTLNVCIVDDDEPFRKSLAYLLERTDGFCCAGSYSSAEEALKMIPEVVTDVVVMDINLPGMSGVECVRKLKADNPALQIIMLTVYGDNDQIFKALKAGANGYLLKRSPPRSILDAIVDVSRGGAPMSSYIARKVVQSFQEGSPSIGDQSALTKREEEILAYVAKGFMNKEIAATLSISAETIRVHLTNIYTKLHVRSRLEAVIKYFQK